ncbi:MAG: ABC transporter substrate-binding protein [Chloroflexota bacterium]|nr:MAG: ABC transporter substrate-binding protein [Chloroflexota bacterium]
MKKRLVVIAAALMLASLGCQSSSTPEASPSNSGGSASIPSSSGSASGSASSASGSSSPSPAAINNDPSAILSYAPMQAMTLDPIKIGASDRTIMNAIYDTLVFLDDNDQPIPGLAISWSSPDPATFELKLRNGVVFQDGTPFNADAVKFNLDRAMSPESMIKASLAQLKAVEVVDPYTVRLRLNSPLPGALPAALAGQAGMMASPTAVKNAGSSDAFSQHPVGAGMFKLQGNWQPRTSASVRAWDGYWDKKSQLLGGIDFKGISPDAYLNTLQAGDVDMNSDLDETMAATLQQNPSFRTKISPSSSVRTFFMNPTLAPFDKLEIRQAMAYAIDRESIAKAMTNSMGQAAWEFWRKEDIAYNADVANRYSYDPNQAKALLAQAGFPNGVSFHAVIGRINTSYIRFGELVRAQIKQAGFDMTLDLVDPAQTTVLLWRAGPTGRGTAQASPLQGGGAEDPDVVLRQSFLKDSPANAGGYEPEGFRALVDQAVSTVDVPERKAAYQEVTRTIQEQVLPGVPVYFISDATGYANYVGGVTKAMPHARQTYRGLYITKGKMPADDARR